MNTGQYFIDFINNNNWLNPEAIPVQNIPIIEDIENNEVEIVAQKPKLKRASLNKEVI